MANTSAINLPKPLLIGAGALILLGLFLASGDPGKAERAQLAQELTEAQASIGRLITQQNEHATGMAALQDNTQLLQRRLEVAEENNTRLRARIDEVERQLAAQRKAAVVAAKKVTAKPTTKSSTTVKKPIKTVKK